MLAPSSSLLPCYLSPSPQESASCVLPCLHLCSNGKSTVSSPGKYFSVEQRAAEQLRMPLRFGKRSIATAPSALLRNVSLSFGMLIDSRLDATARVLLRRTRKAQELGNEEDSKKELSVLKSLTSLSATRATVALTSASTGFQTFPHGRELNFPAKSKRVLVLPLVFKARIGVTILGVRKLTICLKAPGTVTGSFTSSANRLDSVAVVLDTEALLACMRQRCRDLVRKAVAIAYCRAHRSEIEKTPPLLITAAESTARVAKSKINEPCMLPPPARTAQSDSCSSRNMRKTNSEQDGPWLPTRTRIRHGNCQV